jgi:hypothetical protein
MMKDHLVIDYHRQVMRQLQALDHRQALRPCPVTPAFSSTDYEIKEKYWSALQSCCGWLFFWACAWLFIWALIQLEHYT